MESWYEYQKLFFDFDFPSSRFCRLKTRNFTTGHVKNRAKGRPGHSHVVTSYQERSRCQNKLLGPHCGDLIHFIFLYSATAKLSTNLCKTADVTSNLGSDLELLESIECESQEMQRFLISRCKYLSEAELGNAKEDYSQPEGPYPDKRLPMQIDLENTIKR